MAELKLSTAIKERNEEKDSSGKKKAWLNEELYVEFYNQEEPGVPLKFSYGSARKPETFTLLHGGKYRLRREVVNHIESRQVPMWGYKPDGSGRLQRNLEGYKSRFQCRQIFE